MCSACDSALILSSVANCVFTFDKSRDSDLQNGISYTAFEEQWENNDALKMDKLVTPLFEKMALESFGFSYWRTILSTPIQHCSHPL
jgi:hypothetical protein